jgi:hypothetical protein
MEKFLKRVGVPEEVIKLIPEVCKTCKVCRQWEKPGPANVCTTDIPDTFNQQVECDIIFMCKNPQVDERADTPIFHMIDRCTRWHAARVVPSKGDVDLMRAFDEMWVSVHGAPKELIVDGESGIARSQLFNTMCNRKGTKLIVRGVGQHARYAERRGALLKDTVHKIQSQVVQEGIPDLQFSSILAEAVFCGNALLTVNGSTPYNAVYGRVPRILPGLDQIERPDEQEAGIPGLIGHTHRLREISVQAMVEGSARVRLNRATNTRSTAQANQYSARRHLGVLPQTRQKRFSRLVWPGRGSRFLEDGSRSCHLEI